MSTRLCFGALPTCLMLVLGLCFTVSLPAEDKAAAAETEATADVAAEDDRPVKEQWAELFAQRVELIAKLTALQEEFPEAEDDRKEEIKEEFLKSRQELFVVLPKLGQIAEKVFAEDPENLDAGEAAVQNAYENNQYELAEKLATQFLKAADEERDTMIVANIQGIAKFAQHDFVGAHEVFSKLEENGKLHPQLGGRYLEASDEYGEYWEKEAAIRKKEAAAKGDAQLPRVVFKTNRGDIELELFENEAPNTVANFISLIEAKKYDGIKFHRVIPNFMAQGGDPNTLNDDPSDDGQGGPGYTIACECYEKNARKHFRGSISMAHAGKDSGGSQFFLTHLPAPHLNVNMEQKSGHTVFGRVVKGQDIVDSLTIGDEIESAAVERKRDHEYTPETQKEEPAEKAEKEKEN